MSMSNSPEFASTSKEKLPESIPVCCSGMEALYLAEKHISVVMGISLHASLQLLEVVAHPWSLLRRLALSSASRMFMLSGRTEEALQQIGWGRRAVFAGHEQRRKEEEEPARGRPAVARAYPRASRQEEKWKKRWRRGDQRRRRR